LHVERGEEHQAEDVNRPNSECSLDHAKKAVAEVDAVPEHDEGEEEATEAEEDIDCHQTGRDDEENRFAGEDCGFTIVDGGVGAEEVDMSDDHPHHGKRPNSIPNIQRLALPNSEMFHILLKVERVQPFVFWFSLVAFDCCEQYQREHSDENQNCEVGHPAYRVLMVRNVRIDREDGYHGSAYDLHGRVERVCDYLVCALFGQTQSDEGLGVDMVDSDFHQKIIELRIADTVLVAST
jgi:hypothetical protein